MNIEMEMEMEMDIEMEREKVAAMRECLKQIKEIKKLQAKYDRMRKEDPSMPRMPFLEK